MPPGIIRVEEKTADQILASLKLDKSRILQYVRLSEDGPTAAYISGSHVSGFANRWSDLDIFLVGDVEIVGDSISNRTEGASILNVFIDDQRVDYEVLSSEYVEGLCKRFAAINWSQNSSSVLTVAERDFIYRLLVGVSLIPDAALHNLKQRFPKNEFCRYLYRTALHEVDNTVEDLAGLVEDGQRESALLVSALVVESTLDLLNHARGNINPSQKWRLRIAKSLLVSTEDQVDVNNFFELRFPERSRILDCRETWQGYAAACVAFSESVIARVGKEVPLNWNYE
jgi:predicted nucleotidyltransferase